MKGMRILEKLVLILFVMLFNSCMEELKDDSDYKVFNHGKSLSLLLYL